MTVQELIDQLQKVENKSRLVVMAKDGEGNGYSPLSDFWEGAYLADTTWSGEVGSEFLTEEDRNRGYDEEDILEGGEPALILCPVN